MSVWVPSSPRYLHPATLTYTPLPLPYILTSSSETPPRPTPLQSEMLVDFYVGELKADGAAKKDPKDAKVSFCWGVRTYSWAKMHQSGTGRTAGTAAAGQRCLIF